jgi:hypothetical protein
MTPTEAIRRAVAGEIVKYPTGIFSLNRDRALLHAAALALTDKPTMILTRTDSKTGEQYFEVRLDTEPKTSIEDVRKENIKMGWERDDTAQCNES